MTTVTIIGGGLAGSEAAWQLASRDIGVELYEMKPETFSAAHHESNLAELVCSNSFGSQVLETGSGLLQSEAESLGSFILRIAKRHQLPAGSALAVDRSAFSAVITQELEQHPRIRVIRREVLEFPEARPLLICTGPLTGSALAGALQARVGEKHLYFYDAISPIVLGESIDQSVAFSASRYEDGPGDYLNCPFTREQYEAFIDALLAAEIYPTHEFEQERLFHGCQPIEVMARTGREALTFGPMKPVGLTDPRTGRRPYAVVQLRREDRDGQMWNLVGFQTKLRHGEQARIFRMIPGLELAEFVRLGSIHRNTFLNAPTQLTDRLMLRGEPGVYIGGQISGVEGYLESSVCGLMAALYLYSDLTGTPLETPPAESMVGGLLRYLREAVPRNFQPMNSNFGLLPPIPGRVHKKQRRQLLVERAQSAFSAWRETVPPAPLSELQALTG